MAAIFEENSIGSDNVALYNTGLHVGRADTLAQARVALCSLPDDIGTPFAADPHLMHLARINVPSLPYAERLLGRVLVLGVGEGQLALEDEVRRHSGVGVRCIVGIGAVGPREDVVESPGADLGFMVPPRLLVGHCRCVPRGLAASCSGVQYWWWAKLPCVRLRRGCCVQLGDRMRRGSGKSIVPEAEAVKFCSEMALRPFGVVTLLAGEVECQQLCRSSQ